MQRLRRSLTLVLAALIWGIAFVAQTDAMDYIGPFTFNAVRCLIGGAILIPVMFLFRKKMPLPTVAGDENGNNTWKLTLAGGVICGVILFVAANLQQFAFAVEPPTTAGKAGFITALYIIFVPIFGIFLKKRPSWLVWVSVVIAVAGMYLLCLKADVPDGKAFAFLDLFARPKDFSFALGDLLVLLCSIVFTFHILVIDYYSPRVNGVLLSCIQFFVCGIISLVCAFIFEEPSFSAVCSAYVSILYAGIFSCGVAYTLQIIGQNGVQPFIASLLLSLESVFSVLAGWLILKQNLSARELIGCGIIFAAIILAQITPKKKEPPAELPEEPTAV